MDRRTDLLELLKSPVKWKVLQRPLMMLMWYSPHLIVIIILGLGGGVSISIIELVTLEHNIMFDLILP